MKIYDLHISADQKNRKATDLPVDGEMLDYWFRWVEWCEIEDTQERLMQRTFKDWHTRLSEMYRDAFIRAGLPATDRDGRPLTAHGWRAARINQLANSGWPMHWTKKFARHSKITTTEKYYRVYDSDLRGGFEML